MLDVIIDTLIDSVKLLPFLFFTYLAMEYIEHKTTAKTKRMIKNSGKAGPFAGAILGAVPQCGFSAAASNLYAGRVITLGTHQMRCCRCFYLRKFRQAQYLQLFYGK